MPNSKLKKKKNRRDNWRRSFPFCKSTTESSKTSGANRRGLKFDGGQMRGKKLKQKPQRFNCFVLDFYVCLEEIFFFLRKKIRKVPPRKSK